MEKAEAEKNKAKEAPGVKVPNNKAGNRTTIQIQV
jgi:hypothetical protein